MTNPNTPHVAVYAGSFDPPTNGHVDLIERAAALFDTLVVAVGNNPRKRYLFSVEERSHMLATTLGAAIVQPDGVRIHPAADPDARDLPRVEVRAFDGLLVDFCKRVGASVIVRGLRAVADFEFEFQMGLANRDLEPEIETVFLLTSPETLFVSSSIVKEIATGGRDVSAYVPAHVARALAQRLAADAAL